MRSSLLLVFLAVFGILCLTQCGASYDYAAYMHTYNNYLRQYYPQYSRGGGQQYGYSGFQNQGFGPQGYQYPVGQHSYYGNRPNYYGQGRGRGMFGSIPPFALLAGGALALYLLLK